MYRFVVDTLLQPYFVLLTLTGLFLLRLWWRRTESRKRLWCVTIPFMLLWVISTPAVSFFALGTLEWAYPERYDRPESIDAIVVLGGYVDPPNETRPHAELGCDSLSRCLHAAKLYRDGPECPVVLTGGDMEPDEPGPTIAEAMGQFLAQYGIPERDLLLETKSESTYENATETRKLLESRDVRRIVLVTGAIHLRRAEMCFRKQGFEVVPSGCSYSASQFEWSVSMFLPSLGAAGAVDSVLHEWLGIIYYRMLGRT
jgi:uncharacterized SAM-binding protein YcdF (DUF218 family)